MFLIVKCLKDDALYAAKIISSDKLSKGNEQMMFIRESGILHKLKHPAIVKFIGINFHSFEDPSILSPTIITEYLEHGSLDDILKKSRKNIDKNFTPTKKYIALLGIADAMRYLHEKGILHRDLKPQNVLIDHDYYPRVCDFGLSKCFSQGLTPTMQMTMTGSIGTPLYMAPELFDDDDERHHFTAGIDVYAFSMLAYELVTGKVPFMKEGKLPSLLRLSKMVNNGIRPEFTSNVTGKMKDLLNRCWCKESTERPSFGQIFDLLSSDFSFIKEKVDEKEVSSYISKLKSARTSPNSNNQNSNSSAPVQNKKSELLVPLSKYFVKYSDINKEEKIGADQFYEVYKVTLPSGACAMECFPFQGPNMEYFYNSIDALRMMSHVSVLSLSGFSSPSKDDEPHAIFTPFMENGTLESLIEKVERGDAPYNYETIRFICIFGITAGMAYIHQRRVVHRNLKLSNILLDKDFYPKISDFSFSSFCDDDTKLYQQMGTIVYMAPEILRESVYSNKVDVFSYSIVLYELFTGKFKIPPKLSSIQYIRSVDRGIRPKINNSEVPRVYKALIERCWSDDPNKRPSFIQIVKEFIDNKEEFFNSELIDKDELENYIENAIQGLDFSLA